MRCASIRDTLHREAAALDEAQRLRLDDHLADCEKCRRDREQLVAVHRIGAAVEPRLDARAHQRAIARALLEGPRGTPAPERRRWLRYAAFAVAGLAAAAIILWLVREPRDATLEALASLMPPPAEVGTVPPAPADAAVPDEIVMDAVDVLVVDEGTLRTAGAALVAGTPVPAGALLRAPARARVRLASSTVIVAASSELRWQPVERTLLLERGRLDIASGPAGIARVVANGTEVEVGDAEVTVEPHAVRVQRGSVQVRRGSARAVRITAGNAWTLEAAPTAAELLAEARKKFAARDYAAAERAALAAVAARPTASSRTLLADIALAANELDRAVERYLAVANDYAGTPVAESALYAAARTELRRARPAAARALLARYLERYPAGRYVDDVRRQLAAL